MAEVTYCCAPRFYSAVSATRDGLQDFSVEAERESVVDDYGLSQRLQGWVMRF